VFVFLLLKRLFLVTTIDVRVEVRVHWSHRKGHTTKKHSRPTRSKRNQCSILTSTYERELAPKYHCPLDIPKPHGFERCSITSSSFRPVQSGQQTCSQRRIIRFDLTPLQQLYLLSRLSILSTMGGSSERSCIYACMFSLHSWTPFFFYQSHRTLCT
jgi:hypothetical protein